MPISGAIERGLVVAADVDAEKLADLIGATCLVEGVDGFKVGKHLGLSLGLPEVVARIKDLTDLPIIYDDQKAGNDIPRMGRLFAKDCGDAGIDTAILFPFAGPETQRVWTQELQDRGVNVLMGAHMTHPKFLVSEGGVYC